MSNHFFIFILTILLYSLPGFSRDNNRNIKILPVPTIGYSPETGTYLGAVSLFTFDFYNDSITRSSNADLELTYTWKKQLIIESTWNYFFEQEKWFTSGKLHFSDYPDSYFGIGNQPKTNTELKYNSKRLIGDLSLFRNLGNQLFLGPRIKMLSYYNVDILQATPIYAELSNENSFGVGFSIFKDTRNNILTATNGVFAFANATYNFSNTNYTQLSVDLRYYKTIEKTVWASRFLNEFTFGTPPFYDYRLLGGDQTARGYFLGKYRDNHLSTLQTEFRFPVLKWLMLVTFGGVSNIYSSEIPFDLNKALYNAGLGIRFLVDKTENTYLRIDCAFGRHENNGFYISFGESF